MTWPEVLFLAEGPEGELLVTATPTPAPIRLHRPEADSAIYEGPAYLYEITPHHGRAFPFPFIISWAWPKPEA